MPSTKQITTSQGQAWDQIAREHFGSELLMHLLMAANMAARGTLLFSGNVPLTVPALPDEQKKSPTESTPPWQR